MRRLGLRYRIARLRRFIDGVRHAWTMRTRDYIAESETGNVRVVIGRAGEMTIHPRIDAELTWDDPVDQIQLLESVAASIGIGPWLEEHGGWYYLDAADE